MLLGISEVSIQHHRVPQDTVIFVRADLSLGDLEINAKYSVFIEREKVQIEKFKKLEEMEIPEDIDYKSIQGLSNIAISGLIYGNPGTIGQASRISGVTYNDISLLIAVIKNKRY